MTAPVALTGAPPVEARRTRYRFAGYLFAIPAVFLLVVIIIAPIAVVLVLSFTDYSLGATQWSFVGTEHYRDIAVDPTVHRAFANTAIYVVIVVAGAVGLGLLAALLVHGRRRTRRFYEVVFFLPVASTTTAMAIVWQFLLHGRIGPVNALLSALGFERIGFLNEPEVALYTLAAIGIWHLIGFNMILFLAGLTAIPGDLYDAAEMDGAHGFWDRFFRITWPMLGPTTLFVTITTSLTAFQVFDTVAVLTRGGPMGSTDVVLYQMYRESFQYFETGHAAALTIVFLGVILTFALVQLTVFDRRVHYT